MHNNILLSQPKLNLARKWRSNAFDQIIGQDLVVRMLKNSLYLQQYFPVYLFSGQRGCGKTTLARIFAAAINCTELSSFQKNPQSVVIPCLQCVSCKEMQTGSHPDFIEIDAASHTGVDNVRNIIEASSVLPFLGQKKIYLIDEAHMLSKAAFNAFLKILEEPPATVLFILATTDAHKIIDTVKSRCFQLLFRPIDHTFLLPYLENLCIQENIPYDVSGLKVLIKEADGSVRDALNLLEQVRFSADSINQESALRVLGHIPDDCLIDLLHAVFNYDSKRIMHVLKKEQVHTYSLSFIWYRVIELLHALFLIKYGIDSEYKHEQLVMLGKNVSIKKIHDVLTEWYAHEEMFLKTNMQYLFLESLFLKLSHKKNSSEGSSGTPAMASAQLITESPEQLHADADEDCNDEEDEIEEDNDAATYQKEWERFLYAIALLEDPLLTSIFKQGKLQPIGESKAIDVVFAKELSFFKDLLHESQAVWMPLLIKVFNNEQAQLNPLFTAQKEVKVVKTEEKNRVALPQKINDMAQVSALPVQTKKNWYKKTVSPSYALQGSALDVSNGEHWKKTHILLRYFPGTVTEIKGNTV